MLLLVVSSSTYLGLQVSANFKLKLPSADVLTAVKSEVSSVVALVDPVTAPVITLGSSVISTATADINLAEIKDLVSSVQNITTSLLEPVGGLLDTVL